MAHEYLLENGYDGTSEKRNELLKQFKKEKEITDRFELQQLERLQQLQQLQRLQQLERLEITSLSYEKVEVKGKSVVYCDPPYKGTSEYQSTIDYDNFYKWCLDNKNPVFISEYKLPENFIEVAQFEHRSTLSATANNKVIEKLYWNGKNLNKL